MIIGEQGAVSELWEAAAPRLPRPRDDRPGQPVYVLDEPPEPGGSGLRPAAPADLDLLVPACAAAHEEELGIDPLRRDPDGFRWRTRSRSSEGRSWLWEEAATSSSRPRPPRGRPAQFSSSRCGSTRPRAGAATHRARSPTSAGALLERTPRVCLFVRPENQAAIQLYERIGMRHALDYRSVLF